MLSSVLFVAFIVGIASAWARGLQIECGCFGGGGTSANASDEYPWEIARDIGLLLLSLWLVWRPRTPFAVDNLLFRRTDEGSWMSKKSAERSRSERAAAAMAAQRAAERRRQMLVVGAVVVALMAVVGIGYAGQQPLATPPATTPSATPAGVTDGYSVVVGDGVRADHDHALRGPPVPGLPGLRGRHRRRGGKAVEDGKVKVEYRPIAFLDDASTTDYSSRALNALMVVLDESGQDAFEAYHRLLFENQPAEGTAGLTDDQLSSTPSRRAPTRTPCGDRSRTGSSTSGWSTPPTRCRRTASRARRPS